MYFTPNRLFSLLQGVKTLLQLMAGAIGPWDRYQAVDSQQSYIRAQLYIHGPYFHTQTITGILYSITNL